MTHFGCSGRYTINGVFTGVEYKGIVKKLIYNFKYKPHLSDLKNLLVDLLYEAIIQNEPFNKAYQDNRNNLLIVPIPLHSSRFKSRGYNQAEILAKELSKKLNIKMINLLKRTKNTRSQVGLKREDRIKNISGAFSIIPNLPNPPNIFLVDDVFTTGSTLNEAANTLKRNGAKKVWGIALARD
jgi:ComF family protein